MGAKSSPLTKILSIFNTWVVLFSKEECVVNTFSESILMGRRLRRKKKLRIDFERNNASVACGSECVQRPLVRKCMQEVDKGMETVHTVIEDSEVSDAIRSMELHDFSR